MKRGTVVTAVTATVVAAGLGVGLGLGLTPAANASVAQSAATARRTATTPQYVVLNCANKAEVKPASYIITCADAGIRLQGMHWTSWTATSASGYGTFAENNCTPSCAAGHFIDYRAIATLWGSASVNGHPADRRYTELTLIFDGSTRPPVYTLKNGKPVATYPLTQTFSVP